MSGKTLINFRVTDDERKLFAQVAERLNLTQTELVIHLIRRTAKDLGMLKDTTNDQSKRP